MDNKQVIIDGSGWELHQIQADVINDLIKDVDLSGEFITINKDKLKFMIDIFVVSSGDVAKNIEELKAHNNQE